MTTKALTPEQLHALAIIGKSAKKQRKLLKPGTYPLGFTVVITGDLAVAKDGTGSFSSKPDMLNLAKGLLRAIPKTRRAAVVEELVATKCMSTGEPDESIDELATKLVSGCTVTLSGTKKGNVTGKFETLIEE